MKDTAKISAIVTCHNYGHYLAQCLDSLTAQTLPFEDITLINDGSTDTTHAIARDYRDRIRYENVHFLNAPKARNFGAEIARGNFLVQVDADNWLDPHFNEYLVPPLLDTSGLGIAYCGAEYVFESAQGGSPAPHRNFPMVRFSPRLLRRDNFIDNCCVVRRSAWQGQNPEYKAFMDWEHWLRIIDQGWEARLVPLRLFYYRMHPGSLTQKCTGAERERLAEKIREAHRPFERTVILALSGQAQDFAQVQAALSLFQSDPQTQILILDHSGDRDTHQRLRSLPGQIYTFPCLHISAQDLKPGERHTRLCEQLLRVYRFAEKFTEGRCVTLLPESGRALQENEGRFLTLNNPAFRTLLSDYEGLKRIAVRHKLVPIPYFSAMARQNS